MNREMSLPLIWWIRRDLRLADNPALHAALANGRSVIPLFVLDDRLLNSDNGAPQRIAFLLHGLRKLDADLQARGSRLILRTGHPEQIIPQLVRDSGATAVYAQEDVSPFSRKRDTAVAQASPLHLLPGLTVYPPNLIRKADETPYIVFTPFSRAWKALPLPTRYELLPIPNHIPIPDGLRSDPIPNPSRLTAPFPPGEVEAQKRLLDFAAGKNAPIGEYENGRNSLDRVGTSQLSPYLRFGMISARQAVVNALEAKVAAQSPKARKGAESWLNELIWREFYSAILLHFPYVLRRSFRSKYDAIHWRNNQAEFAAWGAGKTGYPVVDAAMRQLQESSWMHNRARMITASFLVKDLLIDWRWGEKWFMQHLVDGDPAANNGGWQWTAGTGTDAAPYFRIFNPTTQGQKFDPGGHYIRRWLPELALVPDKYIHKPHLMTTAVQQKANCFIGQDYPIPIVDHRASRERTLAAYKNLIGLKHESKSTT
jgi:deoxyribodipyrimidine photo-lyase